MDGGVGVGVGGGLLAVAVDDGLNRVAQELADNVLDVAEDVGEAGVEVANDADLGDGDVGPVDGASEGADGLGAALDDVLGRALDEDLADEVGLGELGARGEVGRVEGLGQREVLLGDEAARYARSQYGVHEAVELLRVHQVAALEDALGELGYDGEVAPEVLADELAQAIVVVERLDLLEAAEGVEGVVVEVVDMVDVAVGDDDVGEALDVAEAVGYPAGRGGGGGLSARERWTEGKRGRGSRAHLTGSSVRT